MSIQREANSLHPDALIELFDFDTIGIGGTEIVYLTNRAIGNDPLLWKGNSYLPFPMQFSGVSFAADNTALARPTLSLSNVDKVVLLAIGTLGDLTGTVLRRTRTFHKYTDTGESANILMHYPIEEFIIIRKSNVGSKQLVYELATSFDRPNLKLPKEVILRDTRFPGVSRYRVRG